MYDDKTRAMLDPMMQFAERNDAVARLPPVRSAPNADTHGSAKRGWIGVDLDGTLAEYHGWKGASHIGSPVPKMVDRVVAWLSDADGPGVKIVTARVAPGKSDAHECRNYIDKWINKYIIPRLPLHLREPMPISIPVTHEKDQSMIELWDDRCVQVVPNTGERVDGVGRIDRMTFGQAIEAMKNGKKVARVGWNGKGMWLGMVKADNYVICTAPHGDVKDTPEKECNGLLPWIGMKTADNKFVPWLASQSDMLAEDWMVVG